MEYNNFKKRVKDNVLTNEEIIKYCKEKKTFKIIFYILLICNVLLILVLIYIILIKKSKNDEYKNMITLAKYPLSED